MSVSAMYPDEENEDDGGSVLKELLVLGFPQCSWLFSDGRRVEEMSGY